MSDQNKVTYFGLTDFRNERKRFGIKNKDRARHVYVIGKTGMGKSTLLENMAVQDIQSGEGMCFIDPHGASIEVLLDYIPEDRVKDVVYFAPFDSEYPISFNVMEDVGPDKRHLIASGLMSTFKKIWVDAWSARMEYILNNTILALLEYPDSTLLSVNRMYSDKGFRHEVVRHIKDPSVKSFWVDEFAGWDERYAREATAAIQNKIGQFTANPLIRNIIGQSKSSFNVREMMDKKKIFLVNLSKGQIGEANAGLLGGMIITAIYLGAMSRADVDKTILTDLPPFYLYVDEFQNFANDSFADILAEARKYKLALTIAHQYIAQMEESVSDAVFGNVGTTISYRVGPMDAEVLEKVFSPTFYQDDIVNLGRFQMYLTLMIDEVGSRPFSATGIPPLEKPAVSNKTLVIDNSRENFAKPRGEVQKAIDDWHDQEYKTNRDLKQQEKFEAKKAAGKFDKPKEERIYNKNNNNKSDEKPSRIVIPDEIKMAALKDSAEDNNKDAKTTKPVVAKVEIPKEEKRGEVKERKQEEQDTKPELSERNTFEKKKKEFKPKTPNRTQPKGELKNFIDSVDKVTSADKKKNLPKFSQKEASQENKNTLKDALAKALQNKPNKAEKQNKLQQNNQTQKYTQNNKDQSKEEVKSEKDAKPQVKKQDHVSTDDLLMQAEQVLENFIETTPDNTFDTKPHAKRAPGAKEVPEDVLRSILG